MIGFGLALFKSYDPSRDYNSQENTYTPVEPKPIKIHWGGLFTFGLIVYFLIRIFG